MRDPHSSCFTYKRTTLIPKAAVCTQYIDNKHIKKTKVYQTKSERARSFFKKLLLCRKQIIKRCLGNI